MSTQTALNSILIFATLATPLAAAEIDKAALTNVKPVISTLAGDTGSAERIESAEYLRVYSQEVAAAACYLYNDIEAELSVEMLEETITGFDLHIDALLHGNEELGIIGGEPRRKTIIKMEEVKSAWMPISLAAKALAENPRDTDAVQVIKAENMALFELTHVLVSDLEGEYSNPAELMQSDVLTLEIVGRQAMMSQKIAKFACQMFTGDTSEQVKAGLKEAIRLYEVSLNALINGMPEVGIQPAPTEEIKTALTHVLEDWHEMRPELEGLLNGEEMSRDRQIELYRHMIDEMHELEEVAHAYVVFSKH